MNALSASLNLVLGSAYVFIGVLTLADMRRNWRTAGYTHFGASMVALAFTCGPHHLFHGLHVGFEGRDGPLLDSVAVLVGLPVGAIWLLLRVEAFWGGRGDRFVCATPRWLAGASGAFAAYTVALGALAIATAGPLRVRAAIAPNVALVGVYFAIAWVLLRTQLAKRVPLGGWSVSGVTLTGIFVTCVPMHALHVLYLASGRYEFDVHGFVDAWLGVPAGLYFLWVVRGLYRDMFSAWRREMAEEIRLSAPVAR